jgi:ABC-type uncharacterized transport system permease subunit
LEIENKKIDAPVYKELPYDEATVNQLVTYASVREEAYLDLQWLVDNMLPLYTVYIDLVLILSSLLQATTSLIFWATKEKTHYCHFLLTKDLLKSCLLGLRMK